jgi:hypothetical protein
VNRDIGVSPSSQNGVSYGTVFACEQDALSNVD